MHLYLFPAIFIFKILDILVIMNINLHFCDIQGRCIEANTNGYTEYEHGCVGTLLENGTRNRGATGRCFQRSDICYTCISRSILAYAYELLTFCVLGLVHVLVLIVCFHSLFSKLPSKSSCSLTLLNACTFTGLLRTVLYI